MFEKFGPDGLPVEEETGWDASPLPDATEPIELRAPGVASPRSSARGRSRKEPPHHIPHRAPRG